MMLLRTISIVARCFQSFNVPRCANNLNAQIPVRYSSNILSRTPRAIVNEDEIFEAPEDDSLAEESALKRGARQKWKKKKAEKKAAATAAAKEEFQRKQFKNVFTKLKDNERYLGSVMMQVKSRKQRVKNQRILLEGRRLITDAIHAKLLPEMIIFSRTEDLNGIPPLGPDVKFYKVPYRTVQLWSSLSTPPGLMGVFPMPEVQKESPKESLPLTIICDNVRDPGNMGSLLRSAAGVGCSKVILTKGCVDIWEGKVRRSAAGAHFRVPIYQSQTWDDIVDMVNSDADVFVADNNLECGDADPVPNARKQRQDEDDEDQEEVQEPKMLGAKKSKEELKELREQLEVVPYYAVDYIAPEVVIIIGGETEGLSEESLTFLGERDGLRLNVPLCNGIESLNTGTALGIIAYEVNRQFTLAKFVDCASPDEPSAQ